MCPVASSLLSVKTPARARLDGFGTAPQVSAFLLFCLCVFHAVIFVCFGQASGGCFAYLLQHAQWWKWMWQDMMQHWRPLQYEQRRKWMRQDAM
jgi:hypothetical protein